MKFLLYALVFFASTLSPSGIVLGATVYSQLIIGENISVDNGIYAPEGSNIPMSAPEEHYFELTDSVNLLVIPKPPSGCATGLNLVFLDVNTGFYNANLSLENATDLGDDCSYTFNGTGSYPSGTRFFGWSLGSGNTFIGSLANEGYIVNSTQDGIEQNGGIAFQLCNTTCDQSFTPPVNVCDVPTTRIVDFNPQDNATTSSPVNFDLTACINEEDLGTIAGIEISLRNIDQNVLWLGILSPSTIQLLEENVTEGGLFEFSTTTPLGDGNYRLEACIQRTYLFGFITNPFSELSTCVSHQFVVGSSTFIGNISQRMWSDQNEFFEGLTATSTEALSGNCVPLGNFNMGKCLLYLFIPDAEGLNQVMTDARDGILVRVPWGYFNRFVTIISSSSTTPLPTIGSEINIGSNDKPSTTTISFDIDEMLTGASAMLDGVVVGDTGLTIKEILYPRVQLIVACLVILVIVFDIIKSVPHGGAREIRGKGGN